MGKTPAKKRLRIIIDMAYIDHPAVNKMREQGHEFAPLDHAVEMIISRHAYRMTPEMLNTKGMLELAVKSARLRKEGKDDDPGTDDE